MKIRKNHFIGASFPLFIILLLAACSSPPQEFVSTDDNVNLPMDEAPSLLDEEGLLQTPQIEGNIVYSETNGLSVSTSTPTISSLIGPGDTPSQEVKKEIQPSNPESVELNSGGLQFVEFFAFW